jgi:di/tricarboxylate transporter
MTSDQLITLAVLIAVIVALIWDRIRADVVALAGSAVLLMSGAIRPSEVQGAFASPAILALASLFVLVYAMELSGLLDRLILLAIGLCRRIGSMGLWLLIGACGVMSAFLNNTPVVVLAAPVVRDTATRLGLPARRFLMPLSHFVVLGGCCTLIGTSSNLLVNDMARVAGQPGFGLFEITPVGIAMALAGATYLILFSGRLMTRFVQEEPTPAQESALPTEIAGAQLGSAEVFVPQRRFDGRRAGITVAVFIGTIVVAALDIAPIAASAFAGAVLLILLRVISADEAYRGLRPEILLLIAGMVVIGIGLEKTGLAALATASLVEWIKPLGPMVALAALYGVTLFLTELLSNATVAVLITPVAVAMAESLGVSPRPFVVAVMMAASAAFATPFGYQTNVIVYQLGRYGYMDFVRVGLPLNLITWGVGVAAIAHFFPF